MQLSIYLKKIHQSLMVDTVAMCNGNEAIASQLDAIIAGCKPVAYALAYGLTQSVNDAHAPVALTEGVDKVLAAAQKKLAAILAGTVKVRGTTKGHANPVMHEAMKAARAWWKGKGEGAQNAAIGKVRAKSDRLTDLPDEEIVEIILNAFAKSDATQEKAKAIVAANSKKVDEDFDLNEIGLDDEDEEEVDE